MEKRYKVVESIPGRHIDHEKEWVSFITSPNSDFSLRYRLGETTWGVLGTLGVFVFEHLNHAIRFAECYGNFENLDFLARPAILEGNAIDEKECKYIMGYERDYFLDMKIALFLADSPEGTIRCAGFIPERVVRDCGKEI